MSLAWGDGAFNMYLLKAFVFHASSIAERFPDQKAIHPPGPKAVKHLTQMSREGQDKEE
jgi:hypothetical protein